jgi:beta-mannosidase
MVTVPLSSVKWQFRNAASAKWFPASVPGCVHADLRSTGQIPDPFFGKNELGLQWIERCDWEYRAVFQLTRSVFSGEKIELVCDGLDTVATLFVNGQKIGSADNMFVAHRWELKRHLRLGRNELLIRFGSAMGYIEKTRTGFSPPKEFCDPVGNSARIRKQPCQFGWDWGPRFVTAGIWRDIRLESWSENRLTHARIVQRHREDGSVSLELHPGFAEKTKGVELTAICRFEGGEVAQATGTGKILRLDIPAPKLWWPAGQGDQPLYDLEITARDPAGKEIGLLHRRIGLRTIVLDRHSDSWGESFQFLINGRAVFIKGANWVPAHSFVAGLGRTDYERDLRSAVAANMNCVRLWGGNIYESELFYDVCDELGLLVWHDFMFACTLYPSDRRFISSVRTEATQQVQRIQHRACLALWCGNNELVQLNGAYLRANATLRRGYVALFHRLLPEVVKAHDGVTAYWPSSEWRETLEGGHALGEKSGDSHFWDVWHARHPVKDYEKWAFRFCSEFGMQSYSSGETNQTFCPPEDRNVFGPAMENHQKNRAGNQIILDYVSRRYRFPKSQSDLIYLSQLNQAYCMKTGVEHYRRLTPRCMGTLYWQLNDCWPGASWSSIEFTGRWKALHHAARRFYAPALVCAHVAGDEDTTIGNYRKTTVKTVDIYTVYDAPDPARGDVTWELFHFDGRLLSTGRKRVELRYGQSVLRQTLDLERAMTAHGRDNIYLRLALAVSGEEVSQQSVFFAPPRFLALPKAAINTVIKQMSPARFAITFRSKAFQHAVDFELPGLKHRSTDNYFDLYPNRAKIVLLDFEKPVGRRQMEKVLHVHSLADSYE